MTVEGSPDRFTETRPMEYSGENQTTPQAKCCSPSLKVFIGLLAFCFFTKSLTGAYTKSTITQIERRFEIPSSTVGIIDGSFEMGNLLVITVVSYFGAKFHRPKIIGAGVLLMGIGTLIMALPHFIMSRYMYDTAAAHTNDPANFTMSSTFSSDTQNTVQQLVSGCLKGEVESSPTWVIVLFGNILRGIGEAGIGPLGMSFIDDYARPGNSAFYIGCLHTFGVIGPIFGYSLGSLCASLYVDIGLVDQESVTITPQDSRWVGAWWLGYVVSGLLTLLAALPLWFLPRALPENPQTSKAYHPSNEHKHTLSITEIAKDFWPSIKHLLTNRIYLLYLVSSVLAFNAFAITITYTPKYLEQQFGQSASKTNFLIVCGQNGVTYISPCHAGCNSSWGTRQNMTFHGCTCIQSWGLTSGNSSAVLGQCPRESSCTKMFYIYLALQSLAFFVYCLGTVPFFLISLRIVDPVLKSLSVGILLLVLRVFGGIPAPICFGALIDVTCLKWGQNKCGGRGACRMYDIETFRYLFLGLVSSLQAFSYTLLWIFTTQIKRKVQNDEQMSKDIELQYPVLCDTEQENNVK
uniref:Solute carrier organic anion transporter family member n=1 Tax=Cyprinus carpio TaxID=7962 RepID=A0A8C1N434_CYPCA